MNILFEGSVEIAEKHFVDSKTKDATKELIGLPKGKMGIVERNSRPCSSDSGS